MVTYRRILVPVDGSELSERAVTASLDLARQLHAGVVGFVAAPTTRSFFAVDDPADADSAEAAGGRATLAHFAAEARAAGVEFEGVCEPVRRIDRAIVAAAEAHGCDLIVMVTQGRGAFGEFLFGSQTKSVLAGSDLPLLVLH
jgi:nucleotide-binding universal stress UspA family protein